jgi:integrase
MIDNSLVTFERGQNIVGNRRGGRSPPTTVNSSVRTREYLTTAEIERLMAAARKSSRYGHRDATMILIGYRHGLRASELCDLEWSQIELATGRAHVRRAKNGSPSVHPMRGDEIRALRRLQREQGASRHVFQSERGGPMTPKAFHALFGRSRDRAKMPFPVHPHMLRHGCGYALANAGHDTRALQAWLGHKNIQHTVRPTIGYLQRRPRRLFAPTLLHNRAPGPQKQGEIGQNCPMFTLNRWPSRARRLDRLREDLETRSIIVNSRTTRAKKVKPRRGDGGASKAWQDFGGWGA